MRVQVYRRSDGKWAWRIVARNNQIIATDGGQGYNRKADAFEMVRSIVQGDHQDIDILIQGTDFTQLPELDGVEDDTTEPSQGNEGSVGGSGGAS